MLFDSGNTQSEAGGFASPIEAIKELDDFLSMDYPVIEPGQYVERAITAKYRFPSANQAARCVRKFTPELNGSDLEDMLIAVAISKGDVKFFKVDSRHYRLANAKRGNIFKFGKKI
jgi:hypothetical protein